MLKPLLVSIAFFLVSLGAKANTYYVTTVSDTGAGSLRAMIDTANSHAGLDTILLSLGINDTIHIGSHLPKITDSLVISGQPCQNPTIDGDSLVFSLSVIYTSNMSLPLTLSYLNIINCKTVNGYAHGAVYGGILYINYCYFYGNVYATSAGNAAAGAVCAQTIWAHNATFYNNACFAFSQAGGALYANEAHLYNCTFADNRSEDVGGAITGNGIEMQNCTVTGNSAGNGGGIYIDTALAGYAIANSIIWGNTASGNQNFAGIQARQNTFSGSCNILQDTAVADSFKVTGTDVRGTDTFGYYSGCVPVLPILCGSIAQNHAGCVGATATDAEGIAAQGIRDAGAFEITRPVLGGDTLDSIPHGGTANLNNYFNTTGLTITWPDGLNDSSATSVDAGTYTVIGTNFLGCTDSATVVIVYSADTISTGIKTLVGSASFSIYPNPAKDMAVIGWSGNVTGVLALRVNDMLGRTVVQENLNAAGGKYSLNTGSLVAGVYCVTLQQGEQRVFAEKLIVLAR